MAAIRLWLRFNRGNPTYSFAHRSLLLRQRWKAFAFCLSATGFVNPPICHALASDTLKYFVGAFVILDAKA